MQVELPVGTVFASDFRIERELGKGGMGVVYVATQLSTGRERALKLMHPMLLRDDDMRRRFEQEAKVGSRIKSEHVVQVIAAGVDTTTQTPWIAMELLEGTDLERYLQARGALSVEEASEILVQICHALGAAHDVGVVHRDLKPENVFLTRSHREGATLTVKLLDFGISKIVAQARPSQTAAVGTPLWMAPEQTGGEVTPAADVWSLGLLVFWMLTGRPYWLSASAPEIEQSVMRVLREVVVEPLEPATARARRLGTPCELLPGFDDWFAKCVSRDPKQRFENASTARSAFQRLALGAGATIAVSPSPLQAPLQIASSSNAAGAATAPAASERAGRWRLPALVAIGIAVGAIALLVARTGQAPGTPSAAVSGPAVASASAGPRAALSAPPAPPLLEPGKRAVDHADSKTIWKIPIADSPQRGPADAPVTIVEFANFQCPFSKGVARLLKSLLDEHPKDVRLVWKDDPLAIHSQAEDAAQLARLAREKQGDAGFWVAHDALLDKSVRPTPEKLIEIARKLGLDAVEAGRAIEKRRYLDAIERDADLADDFYVVGTPYFFVNGRRIEATISLDKLRAAVLDELAKAALLERSGVPRADIYRHITAAGRGALPLETRRLDWFSTLAPGRGAEENSAQLVQFCDYTHFMCRLVDPTIDELLERFEGKLGVTWMDVPADTEVARVAAVAGRVTWSEKGESAYNKLRKSVFGAQQGLSKATILSFAEIVGFGRQEFTRAIDDPSHLGDIAKTSAEAKKQRIEVPGFLVCGADTCRQGGYYLSGGHPRRAFEKRIRLVLEAGGKTPTR